MFIVNSIAIVIAAITALSSAYLGFGVWALVFQQVTIAMVTMILIWIVTPWSPSLHFSIKKLRGHLEFGASMVSSQTLGYWTRNADNLLVGKVMGADALGLYSRAYSIMMLPVSQFSGIVASVMFPSFSVIQNDKQRIKYIYLKISRSIAFVTFPMMGILIVTSESFVRVILGEDWIGIVGLLQILAVVGGMQSIATLVGNIFMSQGAMKKYFYVNLFSSIVIVISFIIGVFISLEMVAFCYLAAVCLIILPQLHIAGKLTETKLLETLQNIFPHILINVILISGLLLGTKYLYGYQLAHEVYLITFPILYLLSYIFLFHMIFPRILNEMMQTLKLLLNK